MLAILNRHLSPSARTLSMKPGSSKCGAGCLASDVTQGEMSVLRTSVPFLLTLCLAAMSAQAQAQDDARQLFERAEAAATEERWTEALALYNRAYALDERPFILRNIGVCLRVLGRHVEALSVFQQLLDLTDARQARRELQRWVAEERRAIGVLTIQVAPHEARVFVDGELLDGGGPTRTIPLDPGEHFLLVEADGFPSSRTTVEILPGERVSRHVRLRLGPVLRFRHDMGGSERVELETGGTTRTCVTPCELPLPTGEFTISSGRAQRSFPTPGTVSLDVELDVGWDDTAHAFYTVLGWTSVGSFVVGGTLLVVAASTLDDGALGGGLLFLGLAILTGAMAIPGLGAQAEGEIRVLRDGTRVAGGELVGGRF